MERWTRTPEGTLNVLRTFEETHAISAISNSTPGKALKKKTIRIQTKMSIHLIVFYFAK